ncbi:MAG TPA: SDR family oxidoreductase [Jatrophihabitans sp.]
MSERPLSFGFTPGDVVVVTGAASGIGRATATNAAALGLHVAAWDIDADGAARTVEEITAAGGTAVACTADVSDGTQIAAAFEASLACGGEARYLVNNAGPASASPIEFEAALKASVGGVRKMTEAWLSRSLPADPALVNIASVAGNLIGTAPDWYPAAKAAIMGYTRHLTAYRSAEVRANAVAPGMTDTPRLAGFTASDVGKRVLERIPLHRLATPAEISWASLFLLCPLASYINGVLLVVDGGWTVTQ